MCIRRWELMPTCWPAPRTCCNWRMRRAAPLDKLRLFIHTGGRVMLLCNFNVNNLFVRYKFGKTFPGDQGGKSQVTSPNVGYLPLYQKGAFEVFNAEQRKLAALAITQGNTVLPDVVCIQEVESLIALREFNERFLAAAYPYAVVLDSRDLRQIDVAVSYTHLTLPTNREV